VLLVSSCRLTPTTWEHENITGISVGDRSLTS
jgi:hypothetical protein